MTWAEVCAIPELRDLPFKVETNRLGQIVMSPAKNRHAFIQGKVAGLLARLLPEGEVSVELAVQTREGVKVPDVAWASGELFERLADLDVSDVAPEICVEILSDSNSAVEMAEKQALYFERGAQEVWIVGPDRRVTFATTSGAVERSPRCPDFPAELPRR